MCLADSAIYLLTSLILLSLLDYAFFVRDKKKDFAPNCAAYYPFGVDVFLSQRKIDHIARLVELPITESSGRLPHILVVNCQVPFVFYSLLLRHGPSIL